MLIVRHWVHKMQASATPGTSYLHDPSLQASLTLLYLSHVSFSFLGIWAWNENPYCTQGMLFCSRHSNRSPGCVKDLLRARRVRKSGIQVVLRFSNSRVTKALCYPDLGSVALCGTWSLPGRHHSANFSWRPTKYMHIYIYVSSVTAADSMNASQGLQQCMLNVALHAPLGQNAPNARTMNLHGKHQLCQATPAALSAVRQTVYIMRGLV